MIAIYSRTIDPSGVAKVLEDLVGDEKGWSLEFEWVDDVWQKAVATYEDDVGQWSQTFFNDPEAFAEPNWSNQMRGMQQFLSNFPETDRKRKAVMLPTTFKWVLGTVPEPEYDLESDDGDGRLDLISAVAQYLDGVLFFWDMSLRDPFFRILFSSEGEEAEDPEAVWPKVLAEVSVPARGQMRATDLDEEDADPPTVRRVVERALALSVVTARAVLEQTPGDPKSAAAFRDLQKWIAKIGVNDELEPDEWKVVQTPLGRLDKQSTIDSTWRLEGLTVLAWSLGRFELPPHDELVRPKALWKSLGMLNTSEARELLAKAKLRPRKEIETLRNRLFTIHWRTRNFGLDLKTMDFAAFAKKCGFGPMDLTSLPLAKGDLALKGRRIDRATPELRAAVGSAAMERHKAVNWLWEGPTRYSDTSEST